MDSRPETSGQNFFSYVFNLLRGYWSHDLNSSSPPDCKALYSDPSIDTIDVELPEMSEREDPKKNKNQGQKHKRPMVYFAAMASMFCALCAGFATVYAGPATYDMQTRKSSSIKVTDEEVSWIGSILPIGMLAAIPLTVYLADRIGRKETLIYNTIPFVISWLLTIYAPNTMIIMVGRFFGGWASTAVFVVLPMYAVEISSAQTRGLIGASFQACITIGSLMVMGFGAFLPWSWLAVAGLVLVVIALVVFYPMPESPRWLVANGMKESAVRAIQFLHADQINAENECQAIEENLKTQTEAKFSIQNLRQPIIYKPALISMGQMMFIPFSGSSVIITFSSLILHNAQSALDPKYSTVTVGAVQAVATVLSSLIMDRAGRRVLLLVSGFLMGISLGVLGAYFYVTSYDDTFSSKVGWLPLASLLFYIAVFSIGFGPVPWLMLSEMVPTRERGFISGLATFLLSTLSFVAMKSFENLKKVMNFHGVFWTYSVFCFLSCLFVYFLVPETKGKQLEEIQNIFSGRKRSNADDDVKNSPDFIRDKKISKT